MLKELAERVRSIDVNQILDEVLEDEKTFILDLIRSQLIKGEGGDGSLGIYSKSKLGQYYVNLKLDMGLFMGDSLPNYDLFFSGKLYKSLIMDIRAEYIRTEFTDPKIPLVEESTEMDINSDNSQILGLTEENTQRLIDRIKPKMQNKIHDRINN